MKSPEGKFQKTSTGAVRMQPKSDELKFVTKNDGYVHIHPSSVNYQVRMVGCPYIYICQVLGWKTQSLSAKPCSITCPSPAAPLTWGRSSKHKQTENWALLGNFPFQENSTRHKNMFKPAFRYKIVSLHHRTYLCLKKQWSILANPTSSVFIPPSAYCCEASAPNTPLNSSKVQVTS